MLIPLNICARGSVTLCAGVVGISDIGATLVEVDIQGLWMAVVFSLLENAINYFPN
jgi:hypothetical protein